MNIAKSRSLASVGMTAASFMTLGQGCPGVNQRDAFAAPDRTCSGRASASGPGGFLSPVAPVDLYLWVGPTIPGGLPSKQFSRV
ncbi:MAG: hypothetical protein WBQ31_12775, partial [Candidatus Acidiferrales bacterium]